MVHNGVQHADAPHGKSHSEGGASQKSQGNVSRKEAPSIAGKPREHDAHDLSVEERKALQQQKEEERVAEAAAHRQVRALNMEAGLKPSKRAKKEARAAAKKLAKEQGTQYKGEYGESGDEDDHEEVDY